MRDCEALSGDGRSIAPQSICCALRRLGNARPIASSVSPADFSAMPMRQLDQEQ